MDTTRTRIEGAFAMNPFRFTIFPALAILGMVISSADTAPATPARMKGLSALSQELSARIATPDAPIDLSLFMPGEGLEALAGTWQPLGSEHSFQNGEPNAVNMVLIRLAFDGFAKGLSASCDTAQFPLNEAFYDTLEAMCGWPSSDAQSDEVMQDFWIYLMGYNAGPAEYKAWRDFIRTNYDGKGPRESIEAMTLALMLNPYFLLQH